MDLSELLLVLLIFNCYAIDITTYITTRERLEKELAKEKERATKLEGQCDRAQQEIDSLSQQMLKVCFFRRVCHFCVLTKFRPYYRWSMRATCQTLPAASRPPLTAPSWRTLRRASMLTMKVTSSLCFCLLSLSLISHHSDYYLLLRTVFSLTHHTHSLSNSALTHCGHQMFNFPNFRSLTCVSLSLSPLSLAHTLPQCRRLAPS